MKDLEAIAIRIARKVRQELLRAELSNVQKWRRDWDGVSSEEYLVEKMVGEILIDGKAKMQGLLMCEEYDPTPCCSYHANGGSTKDPCPRI